jgi:hypothetical protein
VSASAREPGGAGADSGFLCQVPGRFGIQVHRAAAAAKPTRPLTMMPEARPAAVRLADDPGCPVPGPGHRPAVADGADGADGGAGAALTVRPYAAVFVAVPAPAWATVAVT